MHDRRFQVRSAVPAPRVRLAPELDLRIEQHAAQVVVRLLIVHGRGHGADPRQGTRRVRPLAMAAVGGNLQVRHDAGNSPEELDEPCLPLPRNTMALSDMTRAMGSGSMHSCELLCGALFRRGRCQAESSSPMSPPASGSLAIAVSNTAIRLRSTLRKSAMPSFSSKRNLPAASDISERCAAQDATSASTGSGWKVGLAMLRGCAGPSGVGSGIGMDVREIGSSAAS
eukprot:CAMPEP_0170257734 /NCGR_PEP_ID=MMETSP0116_2-20130129/28732_1 /TAXON_ID=400756 /ORGANISM="Durinskia baltica, Strain CSIRO CS-38" /LENGTH=226 /DNA_ID=CAMNT_0010508767 /DNA_START=293 /DNA_END=970 /DNA_ORIENTATION=-